MKAAITPNWFGITQPGFQPVRDKDEVRRNDCGIFPTLGSLLGTSRVRLAFDSFGVQQHSAQPSIRGKLLSSADFLALDRDNPFRVRTVH